MKTPFAVATWNQMNDLKLISQGYWALIGSIHPAVQKGWATTDRPSRLTRAGELAMKLRIVLGPDRTLTKAGAKAILRDNGTRDTRTKLMNDGLRKRSYRLGGVESPLTEDGERVRALLAEYGVDL